MTVQAEQLETPANLDSEPETSSEEEIYASESNSGEIPKPLNFRKKKVLNTKKVALKVKAILDTKKITQAHLAHNFLGVCRITTHKLLKEPKPWRLCSAVQRKLYQKCSDWCHSPSAIQSLASLFLPNKIPKGRPLRPNERLDIPVVAMEADGSIDTARVAERVTCILVNHGISQKTFGRVLLNVGQSTISEYLLHPTPWRHSTACKRGQYRRMLEWSMSEASINSLKKQIK